MTTPFEMSRAISKNISGALEDRREKAGLESILQAAAEDPKGFEENLPRILGIFSPESRQTVGAILGQKLSQLQERGVQKEQLSLADQIEQDAGQDASKLMTAKILRSSLPSKEKKDLIQMMGKAIPQQGRLERSELATHYARRIGQINTEMKQLAESRDEGWEEAIESLVKQRRELQNKTDEIYDQDKFVQKAKNKESVKSAKKLEKFDVNNVQHQNRVKDLMVEYNGDRDTVNEILMEEFSP